MKSPDVIQTYLVEGLAESPTLCFPVDDPDIVQHRLCHCDSKFPFVFSSVLPDESLISSIHKLYKVFVSIFVIDFLSVVNLILDLKKKMYNVRFD